MANISIRLGQGLGLILYFFSGLVLLNTIQLPYSPDTLTHFWRMVLVCLGDVIILYLFYHYVVAAHLIKTAPTWRMHPTFSLTALVLALLIVVVFK